MTDPIQPPWPPGFVPAEAPAAAEAVPEAPAPAPAIVRDPKTGRIISGGGRPKGSRNKKGRLTLEAVQGLGDDAVAALRQLVLHQHWHAIRFVLDRCLPADSRTIELTSATDPNCLIEAAAEGAISPSEFAKLAQAWKTASEASELRDLKARLDELENLILQLKK